MCSCGEKSKTDSSGGPQKCTFIQFYQVFFGCYSKGEQSFFQKFFENFSKIFFFFNKKLKNFEKNFLSQKFFLQNFDFSSFPLCFVYPTTFLFPQKEAIKARNVGREVESFFVFSLIHRCIILGLLVISILARARRHFWSHRKIAFFGAFA